MSDLINSTNDAPIARAQIVIDAIASGANVRDASAAIGITAARFFAWLEANADLREQYQQAQIKKAIRKFGGAQ